MLQLVNSWSRSYTGVCGRVVFWMRRCVGGEGQKRWVVGRGEGWKVQIWLPWDHKRRTTKCIICTYAVKHPALGVSKSLGRTKTEYTPVKWYGILPSRNSL
jgi:hypothetical protein